MGLRNPSRLSIDPNDDTVYTAWVGPDAGSPSATQGPSTYENAAQISRAANYGWPYCMGSKQAYRDRIADGALRTDSPEGYVPGGPATGGTEGWYDCDNLRNDSPNNTGLVELPHQTGTGMDAGKVRGNNLWWSRGNPSNANGCPEFPRQRTAPAGRLGAPNYGATPTQGCPYVNDQGLTVMNGPLYRYETGADNSRRWPAVLGRPLVPAQQRRRQRQARPAAGPGDRPGRRPAGLRRQPPRRAVVAGLLHGLEVRP